MTTLLELVDRIEKNPTKWDVIVLRSRIESIKHASENYAPDLFIQHVKDILIGDCITY